jgi:azurin
MTNRQRRRIGLYLALCSAFATAGVATAQRGAPAGAARVVEVAAADNMRFAPASIEAKAGERLRLRLKVTSALPKAAMAHNIVILKNASDANMYAQAAMLANTTNYVPAALQSKVIAATALAGAGETVEVEFVAPATPGSYTFLCSFPGHFSAGMKGLLIVK